jgi:Fur family ferric uptake transcriptional regulator
VDWAEHARARLRSNGQRAGGAREEVLGLLSRQQCCLTAQQIHDALRAGDRRVGLASVYRALDLLTSLGLVHRVDVEGTAAFEPADPGGGHHHHLVCSSCGRVDAFEDPALEQAIEHLSARVGYTVQEHDVVLRCACANCAESPPDARSLRQGSGSTG